jgi:hypothetical protein
VAEAIAQPDLCTTSRFDRTVVWAKVRGRRLRVAYEVRQSEGSSEARLFGVSGGLARFRGGPRGSGSLCYA